MELSSHAREDLVLIERSVRSVLRQLVPHPYAEGREAEHPGGVGGNGAHQGGRTCSFHWRLQLRRVSARRVDEDSQAHSRRQPGTSVNFYTFRCSDAS
jgi:hypothetical protein